VHIVCLASTGNKRTCARFDQRRRITAGGSDGGAQREPSRDSRAPWSERSGDDGRPSAYPRYPPQSTCWQSWFRGYDPYM